MPQRASEALQRLRDALDRSPHAASPHAPLLAQLRSARDLGRARREAAADSAPLATAVPALDGLLAGGLPRGQLVELIGRRSSGRFSTVLATLAAATAAGESAALVDLGDGLDPQAAATLGVDLERLLWLRPQALKQALASAEILITGGFSLVALDLGSPPVRGGRGAEAAWLRLARAAQAHDTVLLVASPYRMSGTAAAAVLQSSRRRILWQTPLSIPQTGAARGAARAASPAAGPILLNGLAATVALEKRRGLAPADERREPLDLFLPEAAALLDPLAAVALPAAAARTTVTPAAARVTPAAAAARAAVTPAAAVRPAEPAVQARGLRRRSRRGGPPAWPDLAAWPDAAPLAARAAGAAGATGATGAAGAVTAPAYRRAQG